ncbi:MAG: spore coat associated protein CotJA [Ruminococcaceae bacterium]|nr:spore coat associated protein CotJA [Oscillospiraceae bacterium]
MDRYKKYNALCSCNDGFRNKMREDHECTGASLAMPVMPIQEFRELYSPCEALEKGTLYKELYKPYCVRGGYKC